MKLADGIQKFGFRRWYERELMQSHAYLVLTFACAIGLFAALEALTRFRGWGDQAINVLAMVLCAAIGAWSVRRYLYLLGHAEMVARQAECRSCGTYGRLRLVHASTREGVNVRCAQCDHRWRIDD